MTAFFGVIVGLSILGILGAILMTFCDKYKCRYLIYFACSLLVIIGIVCFLLAMIFSLIVPVFYFSCEFIQFTIASKANFDRTYSSYLRKSWRTSRRFSWLLHSLLSHRIRWHPQCYRGRHHCNPQCPDWNHLRYELFRCHITILRFRSSMGRIRWINHEYWWGSSNWYRHFRSWFWHLWISRWSEQFCWLHSSQFPEWKLGSKHFIRCTNFLYSIFR